mgnify:FL=1
MRTMPLLDLLIGSLVLLAALGDSPCSAEPADAVDGVVLETYRGLEAAVRGQDEVQIARQAQALLDAGRKLPNLSGRERFLMGLASLQLAVSFLGSAGDAEELHVGAGSAG